MEEYFLVAVSTQENLDLCMKYAYAGFPDTLNGLWAYLDIKIGDYISFLYGAKAYNLYKVVKKDAIVDAVNVPPWKPLHFKSSGIIVSFPFRLTLEPVREFEEPIARQEFYYIAENLLQRGGYWKTHFQADQTTFHNVSRMGNLYKTKIEKLELPPYETLTPTIRKKGTDKKTGKYPFREIFLQSLIRAYLYRKNEFNDFIKNLHISNVDSNKGFEILGEKALPEGLVDILIKESNPVGITKQIIIEVKMGKATLVDIQQLKHYMGIIGDECIAGVMVSSGYPKNIQGFDKISLLKYSFQNHDLNESKSFEDLLQLFKLLPY